MTLVDRNCPEYSLGGEGDSNLELIDKLKKAMPKGDEGAELLKLLEHRKSTPEDLEQAYMDIPQIVTYYAQVKDQIDGSEFSAFGSLATLRSLLEEVKECTKVLDPKIQRRIKTLYEDDYPKREAKLEQNKKTAAEESEQLLSCVDIADKELTRRKSGFCDIAGSSLKHTERDETGNDTEKEKELSYCKQEGEGSEENQSNLPPQGASARVLWWGKKLVELFKALGITEERGKKSSITCDSFSVPLVVVHAYTLEIEDVINKVRKAEEKEDPPFKKDLDEAWKEWISATYSYIKQYLLDKDKKEALTKAETELNEFRENKLEKYLRDAQDVEAGDDEPPCD